MGGDIHNGDGSNGIDLRFFTRDSESKPGCFYAVCHVVPHLFFVVPAW